MNSGSGNSQVSQLEDQQIMENQAELDAKKTDLFKTRLDIIRSNSAQQFTPDKSSLTPKSKI